MIPASELAALRTAANLVLDQTCTIQHVTTPAGSYGEATEGLSAAVTVNCLVTRPSAHLMALYASRIGDLAVWQIVLPDGTDVRMNDVLTVGGQTLRVQAVLVPQSYSVLDSVLASEVR